MTAKTTEQTQPAQNASGWATETLYDDAAIMLRVDRMLYDSKTEHQRIQVFQNARFGRVLTLDGVTQVCEADEFIYHEMLTHTPLLAHGSAKRVLIIGGGDGGILRETARHPGVEKITMVEIDRGVVDFSKKYLPNISNGAFDDPRLELVIEDGAKYVQKFKRKSFDVIIVDSTDPIGPGEVLFTDHFYGHCRDRLAKGGILVTQNGVPFQQGAELTGTMRAFKSLFADWSCYLATVPTYWGGPMAFGWASDSARRRQVSEKVIEDRYRALGLKTRYYTPAVHKAAFALPGYVQELMPK